MNNNVTVVGNLTREPELRFTPSGQAICDLGIAENRSWDKGGERQERTSFFDITVWGQLGENVAQSLTKGARIIVTGRLEQQTWENPAGEKRSKIIIVADEVAPSLRWATCEVSRIERSEGSQASNSQPAHAGARSGSNGGGRTYTAQDEEPF